MTLKTAPEIIDLVGGTAKFAAWYGVSPQCVSAWRKRGFSARTYVDMSARLRDEHQIVASASAWKMKAEEQERAG